MINATPSNNHDIMNIHDAPIFIPDIWRHGGAQRNSDSDGPSSNIASPPYSDNTTKNDTITHKSNIAPNTVLSWHYCFINLYD